MDPHDLELAAEFCKLVGAPNLLVYLGLDEKTAADEARSRLKARRKYMQGMQGNPKYKKEALFLIKHFSNLNDVLGDTPAYVADARRRAESEHLPVIEMTVRGVLAAGGLTEEQEDYLRRNAIELGVSEQTFRELLARVGQELGVPMRSQDPSIPPVEAREVVLDLYGLLGVSPIANEDDVRIAYRKRLDDIAQMHDPEAAAHMRKRIEIAQKVLSNEAARRHYDLTAARTGPPARSRELRPAQAATAPPVRDRTCEPVGAVVVGPRLEILGEPVRPLRLGWGMTVHHIVIRNGGEGAMGGVVSADVPWMAVDPTRLDPAAREQRISVQVDRGDVPEHATSAVVTIQTDRGDRARVAFHVRRGPSPWLLAGGAVGLAALATLLIGIAIQLGWLG